MDFKKYGIHADWHEFLKSNLSSDNGDKLKKVLSKGNFVPAKKDIFNVFKMSLADVKCIIVGQD